MGNAAAWVARAVVGGNGGAGAKRCCSATAAWAERRGWRGRWDYRSWRVVHGTSGMATIGGGGNGQSIVIDRAAARRGQRRNVDRQRCGPRLTALGSNGRRPSPTRSFKNYTGIFDSQLIRTQQFAAPLANLRRMAAGIARAQRDSCRHLRILPQISPPGLLISRQYVTWTLGFPIVPMLAQAPPTSAGSSSTELWCSFKRSTTLP